MAKCTLEYPGDPDPLPEERGVDCGKDSQGRDIGCGVICESERRPDGRRCCRYICNDGSGPRSGGCLEDGFLPGVRSIWSESHEVDVAMQDLSLVQAANLLDSALSGVVVAPAGRENELVELRMSGTVGEVLEQLGLHYERVPKRNKVFFCVICAVLGALVGLGLGVLIAIRKQRKTAPRWSRYLRKFFH